MEAYQYKYGDRPLEGYTIQRAAGRGGFGEVYYAVSDSGRQVALKVVQSYEQIELRGITQCMNLKSPHLVTVFDVKYNDQNKPFVVMEYVSGPALSDLMKESPGGLGTQKTAFFLQEIAKGLSYLHECGIVHRDLKPSNIFYENGYVKIGDYGLTKAISTSQHVSHTITVGTVHYMAPEIGAGKYDRSVDIYALGILLYEMLTGQLPFMGASPAEILMKHMTAPPELEHVDEPFRRVIRKALAKDPAERYQTVQQMVEDVFGAEHVRNSVSQFAPEELSIVAEHMAKKVADDKPKHAEPAVAVAQAQSPKDFSKEVGKHAERIAKQVEVIGGQVAEKLKNAKERADQQGRSRVKIADSISPGQRRTLSLITMVTVALGAAFFSQRSGGFAAGFSVFVMIGVASKVILYARREWWSALDEDSRKLGKAATCFIAAFLSVIVASIAAQIFGGGPFRGGGGGFPFGSRMLLPWSPMGRWGSSVLALAVPMLLADWHEMTDPKRKERVALGHAIWLGFLGYVAGNVFGMASVVSACTLAGIALVVQAASPVGQAVKKMRVAKAKDKTHRHESAVVRPVPGYARPLWLAGWLLALGLGLFLCILAGMELHGDEYAFAVAFGVDSFILSLLCFIMMFRGTFKGWYRYLIRPGLLVLCVQMVVTASILLGHIDMNGPAMAIFILMIILPSIMFFIFLFTPATAFGAARIKGAGPPASKPAPTPAGAVSPAKRLWALLLAFVPFIPFLPIAGLHRFYVGKVGTGILWFFTGGLVGIGQLIDIILIALGQFTDKDGLPVAIWHGSGAVTAQGVGRPAAAVAAAPAAAQVEPAVASADAAEPKEQAIPEPAAQEPPSSPSYANTGTIIYEPWHPLSSLIAALGHIFLLGAILVGLAIGLRLPSVVAAGWPDPEISHKLEQVFGYAEWPGLMEKGGILLIVVLLFTAAVFIMIGRRKSGAAHLVRALLGLGGFLWAIQLFRAEVMSNGEAQGIVDLIQQNQVGPALERLFGALSQEEAIFAGVIALVSVLVLAWPPRRRTPIFAPTLNQGVI